jgi:hypothetical protein
VKGLLLLELELLEELEGLIELGVNEGALGLRFELVGGVEELIDVLLLEELE